MRAMCESFCCFCESFGVSPLPCTLLLLLGLGKACVLGSERVSLEEGNTTIFL
jgi:hypothetical protein